MAKKPRGRPPTPEGKKKIDHCAVDKGFDRMGRGVLFGEDDSRASVAELVLWRKVVQLTIADYLGETRTANGKYHQFKAEHWLFHDNVDFFFVCDIAGINGAHLRLFMLATIANEAALQDLRHRIIHGC